MILHIKKKDFKYWGIVGFLFFFLTVDFRTVLFRNTGIAYAFAAVSLFLLLWGSGIGVKKYMQPVIVLWILSLSFVITSGNISMIIKYIFGLLILYCFGMTNGTEGRTVKIIAICGIIFSTASFLFYLFPDIYINKIVPHLEDYLQSQAVIMIKSNRYPGLTGHYSTNGIYLAFGVGAACALYLTYNKGIWRKISFICFILGVGALLLIGKRAHLVFSLGSCFFIYWISNNKNQLRRLWKVFGMLIISAVIMVVVINQIPGLTNTFERFIETASSGDFLMSRGKFYMVAIEQFKENPIVGAGWRTMMMDIIGHDVHNIYLQLLAENGLFGFIFYVSMLIYGLIISAKEFGWASRNRDKITSDSYALLAFATLYMYFFVLYGMTGNPLYDEQTYYVFTISYGAILYARKSNSMVRKTTTIDQGDY